MVERYSFDCAPECSCSGEYVRHEDYVELKDKLENAERDLRWLREQITDIYKFM